MDFASALARYAGPIYDNQNAPLPALFLRKESKGCSSAENARRLKPQATITKFAWRTVPPKNNAFYQAQYWGLVVRHANFVIVACGFNRRALLLTHGFAPKNSIMSEGPEIHRLAAQLAEEFGGNRIVAIESRLKKARAWLEERPGLVEGCLVRRIYAAGKNLIWDIEGDIFFHIHLLMYGKIRTYSLRHRIEYDRATRAVIVTTARQAVLINVQVFNIGVGDPFEQVATLRDLGPDICAVPFDAPLFLERLHRPDNLGQEIAPVLLDQTVAAGLGNYLKSDILFECCINPWTLVRELSPAQQQCLTQMIPAVAQRALHKRGQIVTDEVLERIQAELGDPQANWWHKHWVFRHTNRQCKICGAPIKQKRQGPGAGRITYYCPECQGVA